MRKLALEFAAAAALTIAAIISLASGVRAGEVMVRDAFARASATPAASAGTVYLTISNTGTEEDRLIAVSSPVAEMAHLHRSIQVNGATSMVMVQAVDVPAGESVALEPGGLHIMLMGMKSPLKKGGMVALVLTFAKAGEVKLEVPVAGVAATAPDQAGSSGG
jgi:hypothetical protein